MSASCFKYLELNANLVNLHSRGSGLGNITTIEELDSVM